MTTPARRNAPRKAEAAVGLKLAGATYAEIADALGYTDEKAALNAVEKVLSTQVDEHSKAELRVIASARYERLLRAIWPKAIDSNNPEQLPAVRTARELIDRYVSLHGVAEPVELTLRTPGQQELEKWVAEVTRVQMPDVVEADVLGEEEPPALTA